MVSRKKVETCAETPFQRECAAQGLWSLHTVRPSREVRAGVGGAVPLLLTLRVFRRKDF